MKEQENKPFSTELQQKIDKLCTLRTPIKLGKITFDSPLILAPMSAITNMPFRLLMQNLGAGGSVSELISCHGINYKNEMTLKMLKIDPRERNCGIQLFGEDARAMAEASKIASSFGPQFIDINMGCPVRKVVTKGGGSALLKDPRKLGTFFSTIKKALDLPLTIKIRTGWDKENINAAEVIHIAHNEGIEFVAIHGRTRAQAYQGHADWELLEELNLTSALPLIGNGDLHTKELVQNRLRQTSFQALMVGRGALRNPFIFLEGLISTEMNISFTPKDYYEIIQVLHKYCNQYSDRERTILVQLKKHIVWFSTGLEGASKFRSALFSCPEMTDVLKMTEDFFLNFETISKRIKPDETFMCGGHG